MKRVCGRIAGSGAAPAAGREAERDAELAREPAEGGAACAEGGVRRAAPAVVGREMAAVDADGENERRAVDGRAWPDAAAEVPLRELELLG